jgi:two-component SAPR family response regulator
MADPNLKERNEILRKYSGLVNKRRSLDGDLAAVYREVSELQKVRDAAELGDNPNDLKNLQNRMNQLQTKKALIQTDLSKANADLDKYSKEIIRKYGMNFHDELDNMVFAGKTTWN